MARDIHIVDVFAEQRFGGNPLGVVIHDGDVVEDDMQPLARELGYSETTFVERQLTPDGDVRVRIFTPTEELPFAGHPTLGTAWVARQHLLPDQPELIHLDLTAGRIPVRVGDDGDLWLTAPMVELGRTWSTSDVYATLGIARATPPIAPTILASAGMPILIVPVPDIDALRTCDLDSRAFRAFAFTQVRQLFSEVVVYAVYVGAREPGNHLAARMFIPDLPVRTEDPATGAAAACLGAYLLEHDLVDCTNEVRIEQGVEMGRPSILRLLVSRSAGGARIEVGGRIRPVLQGNLTF